MSARTAGRKGRPWRRLRDLVLAASGGICALCGLPGANSVDHIVPLSKGGAPMAPSNLRAAHSTCNSKRGNRMQLRTVKTSRDWYGRE
ncbi:HNH endonuclease [Cryptosporangium sp. NPDC051539]|uniref:HNH endonuclease n=1 Tax=Cryptosporangium sp. NPDC051539 TaxID=3363962 RepID=UPI0037A853C4